MDLSIIVTAYNLEKYIINALETLKNQYNGSYEVIIIDDGSTDNTYEVIQDYIIRNKLSNFKFFKKKNEGVSIARNFGLKKAQGKYIMFLDGDDYINEFLVEKVITKIQEKKYDVICWGFNIVNENGVVLKNYFDYYCKNIKIMSNEEVLYNILIKKNMYICIGSSVFKKSILLENNILFYPNCANGEDQEFIYKAIYSSNKIIFINEIMTYYVKRQTSISNSFNIKRFDFVDAFERTSFFILGKSKYKNEMTKEIINYLSIDYKIENYISNFTHSIIALRKNKNMKWKHMIKFINREIGKNYPSLNFNIKNLSKEIKVYNFKLYLKSKVFFLTPKFYTIIVYIKNEMLNLI